MNNEQKYSVMTVKDMFWKIVSAWKLLIILAVVGAIAGGWFSGRALTSKQAKYDEYVKVLGYSPEEEAQMLSASDTEKTAYAEQRANTWKAMLNGTQLNAINDCISIKKLIAQTNDYIDNSVYMQVDPYDIDFLTKVYQLNSDVEGLAGSLIQTYLTYATGGQLVESVAEGLGWKEAEIIYSDLFTAQVINGVQLKITFFCRNAEELATAEKLFDESFKVVTKEYRTKYGEHSFVCIDTAKSKKADINIANTQNTVQARMSSYNSQVTSFVNTFKTVPVQMNYYNYLSEIEDGKTGLIAAYVDEKQEVVAKPAQNKSMYMLIGALGGMVIAVIIVLCICLANGRLLKTDEMVTIFGLPYIGSLVSSKWTFIIDKMIKKLSLGNEGPYDKAKRLELVSSKIAAVCRNNEIKEIAVVGTSLGKAEMTSLTELQESLKEQGIKVTAVGNIISDKNVSEASIKVQKVFVIETVGKSYYKDIEKELYMIDGCGIQVVGAGCIE